ncbi:MAG: hypothetical protein N2Z62_10285 [Rhodobacteraceae bacterium]|nr:hypothetical protein [Paracoccaceae bacterium]
MPTLDDDSLVFHFPQVDPEATFRIEFQRRLRIPVSGRDYPTPTTFGSFPLRHVEDYAERLPAEIVRRGGVMLPIWQAEAIRLSFFTLFDMFAIFNLHRFAVKVAAGNVNAVTGEAWQAGLNHDPQDYMVCPPQLGLDGFTVEPGIVRQFVAMPIGKGCSEEEQPAGGGEWGGFQIAVVPLKADLWQALRNRPPLFARSSEPPSSCIRMYRMVSLGAGGRMHQRTKKDQFAPEDWDVAAAQRVFVTLIHAKDWESITGNPPPTLPPTARDYAKAGLPWFECYGADRPPSQRASGLFGRIRSLGALFRARNGRPQPESEEVKIPTPVPFGSSPVRPRPIRSPSGWDV